jgi:ATP-dependent DNA ligase
MQCIVACNEATYANPPKEGIIVTVKHEGVKASGKLNRPVYFRIRKDVTWEDLQKA